MRPGGEAWLVRWTASGSSISANGLPVPSALLLADQGAEVIHVDPPGGPRWQAPANATLQRGKHSIILDLKTSADLTVARALIGSADVLIENFRPGVMDRLGLGWDAVGHGHDRLIYCSLPGFAADDRRAAMPAWEGVLAAATGTYASRGPASSSRPSAEPAVGVYDQPRFNALPLASEFGALVAAIAIVMALIARERDGLGQRIEVPRFDAMFLAFGASGLLVNGAIAGGRPADPWSGTYECRDGALVLLNLATPRFVHRFLEVTGTLAEWRMKGYLESDRLVHDNELWARQRQALSALLRAHRRGVGQAGHTGALPAHTNSDKRRMDRVKACAGCGHRRVRRRPGIR